MFTDITERKEAEQSLLQAKNTADQANRAKDQFMARLSHELRTPLTPVLLAMAQWQLQAELPPELRDDLTMMRRNLDLEARLLDDLLDVSRIVNGKMMLRRGIIDVHQKIADSLEIVAADVQMRQLKLVVRLQAARTWMDGDPARIQQVIWNLLSNAIKFTPEGGSIAVGTVNDADEHILVQITDSGMGITPELMPRLFKPFEQGGEQTTRGYGGLGLGLAICRSVAEMHGGSIAAQSEGPGRGANFTLRLPTVALPGTKRSAPVTHQPGPIRGRCRRILLVEDHPDTARLLSRVLGSWGYEVRVAQSVASGLEAASPPFDLLISDLGLPDGTGHDLMRQLRARGPLKAIAVSGYGMEEDQQRSREAGFLAHLTKPVNLAELRSVLRRTLDGD
jgi:CheY-like chemotaxis protein